MIKKFLIIGILFLFLGTIINLSNAIDIEKTSPTLIVSENTLFVGGSGSGNYSNIQDAIDAADDYDNVYVYSGTYDENIELNKRLNLIGEDKNTTIINGNNKGCTINLTSENSMINNFTIIGGGFDTDDFKNFFRAGLRITGSNNIICNNIFRKNRLGLSCVRVMNLTIKDNNFFEDGIVFTSYENDGRPKLKIDYFLHNIENNYVNGKPIFYFCNEEDTIVDNLEIGQLILVNCTNFEINNISISETDFGLLYYYCNYCITEKCNIKNNSLAIWTYKSNKNIFQFNNISNSFYRGIVIDYNSNNNEILHNEVFKTFCGVEIEWYSNFNLVSKNNFIKNNVSGFEHQSFFSKYKNNYYDDWIGIKNPNLFFLPKLIFGMPIEKIPSFTIPVGIDFCPAKETYDISLLEVLSNAGKIT